MRNQPKTLAGAALMAACAVGALATPSCEQQEGAEASVTVEQATCVSNDPVVQDATSGIEHGRQIFRFDTFGDEDFWGGALRLHEAIEGANLGGVGPGLSPTAALGLGLKVDVDALSPEILSGIQDGTVDLDDPATTLALLARDAVVGVKGFFSDCGALTSVGIQCALCHSIVDDSLTPGIGHRLDGWPNRDLDIGTIITLSPDLSPLAAELQKSEAAVRNILLHWGPGRFDAELLLDGKGFRPDGKTAATVLPAAFGLAGVNLHTYTGWGSIPYWNAFVAIVAMHGKGTFFDPRLDNPVKFPLAVANGYSDIRDDPDLVTSKLPDLHLYQISLKAPSPPPGSFDADAAARGEAVFNGPAQCARCHVPPLFTEPGWNMHRPAEIGIDGFQARRSPDNRYRTTPLKGLFTRMKGGFYHDGRFPTLEAVVEHYEQVLGLGLTTDQRTDLVEYLKSL
jgi:hypothetical protein